MTEKTKAVITRFFKGFISAGFAQVSLYLSAGVTVSTPDDLKKLGYGVLGAFLTGAVLAIEKSLTWRSEL